MATESCNICMDDEGIKMPGCSGLCCNTCSFIISVQDYKCPFCKQYVIDSTHSKLQKNEYRLYNIYIYM